MRKKWKMIKTIFGERKTFWTLFRRRIQNQQANPNWCLVDGFSSVPAISMTLMGVLPMTSPMAVPWWLTSRSDPFLNCSISVGITTLAKLRRGSTGRRLSSSGFLSRALLVFFDTPAYTLFFPSSPPDKGMFNLIFKSL